MCVLQTRTRNKIDGEGQEFYEFEAMGDQITSSNLAESRFRTSAASHKTALRWTTDKAAVKNGYPLSNQSDSY